MAPPKRSSRAVAARQSKLSFKSNVSKAAPINSALKKDTTTSQKRAKSPTVQNIDDPSQEVGEEQPRIQQKQLKSATTKEEEAARKISSLRLKQYYATILNSRLTAPVHQHSLTLEEKILRHFDLSSQYGPCIGITRANRWKRAHRLGLKPPIEALTVALQMEDEAATAADNFAHKRDPRRAYVDDFLSARTTGE